MEWDIDGIMSLMRFGGRCGIPYGMRAGMEYGVKSGVVFSDEMWNGK